MPARNAIKVYARDSVYHLYNRGVEKRKIFLDQQDYAVFLSYLKEYLQPKAVNHLHEVLASGETSTTEKNKALKALSLKNFSAEIDLLCYVLMPNHFHLLIKQKNENSMNHFMRALGTRYTVYFNRKYNRIGKLYQGVYKAVMVNSDEQLLHLSRYIHTNPIKIGNLLDQPSSLSDYFDQRQTDWIKTEPILTYFHKDNPNNSYRNFMDSPEISVPDLSSLAIDLTDED